MASKKKRGGRDDIEWDSDLDFDIPDFGGDNPEVTSNNRKPIATGLKSAAEGFGKTFTNEARLRKTLTRSLPREYEEPISKAFEIKDGARDLYNIAGSQVNETVRETKRSVGRIARNLESALPRGVYEKVTKWAATADQDNSSGPSKDEVEQGTINNAMLEIFAESTKADADNRKKDQAREIMQDAIDKKRHADMTAILGSIDQSLISLQTFQDKAGTNYMKKSLELQFRSYFVQNDMLQLQTKFFEEFKNSLGAITKNTGLPDYVKKAPKEALMERLREKTFDSLGNTIAKKRNEWLSGVVRKAGNKIKDTFQDVRDGASQILDTAEMATSMYGSGMGPSAPEFAGDLAGGYAGNKAQDFMAKHIKAYMLKNPGALKKGNQLSMIAGNLPQWINQQVTSGQHADKIPDWLKDILAQDGERSGVAINREVDLERAAQFSDKNSRSLNYVIPQLLSKIHHELYVTRTGDVGSKPLSYDFEKGKFVTSKERQEQLANSIVSKRTVEHTQGQVDSIFKEIDPEGKLDKETRDEIAKKIYGANKKGAFFDRDEMMRTVDNDKAAALLSAYVDRDSKKGHENKMSKMFGRVGGNNGEVQDLIQELIDNGRHGELADLGIIDLKSGKINLDVVRQMELGQWKLPEDPTQQSTPGQSGQPGGSRPPKVRPPNTRQGGFIRLGSAANEANRNQAATGPAGASLEDLTKAFKEAMGSSGGNASGTDEKLIKAISEASGKTELTEIRDILKRIEEKGIQGGGIMTPEMLEQYMSGKFGGFFGKAGQMGRGAVGKVGNWLKGGFNNSMGLGKKLGGWAKTGGKSAFNWLGEQKDKFDLFIGNEVEPRLNKAKLEAGRYYDINSKKIVTKFEDITGDIKDLDTDKIVLKYSELKDSVLKNFETGKSVLGRMTSWGKKSIEFTTKKAKELAEKTFSLGKTAHGMAWSGLKKAYEFLTDGPMDVYLKDNYETPVLLKRVMAQGLYFDKESLDSITKVSEIKGAVVDNQENVLITKEDLHNGLYDKHGKEIKTGFDRVLQFVGGSIKKTIGTYKKILGKAKDMGVKAMGWLKGLFGFDSPFTVFSKRTNDILGAIYNLLNDRMPGERSPDLDTAAEQASSASGGGGKGEVKKKVGVFKEAFMKRFSSAKDKAEEKLEHAKLKAGEVYENRDEHWNKARDEVAKHTGNAKERGIAVWDKMYKLMEERLPAAKKKVFGDTDGDGDRDGDIDDTRSRRQKAKDAAREAKDKALGKVKDSGAYATIAKLLADLIKKNKKEEEEDDDDGIGLDDVLGDGDDNDEHHGDKKKARDAKRKRRLKRLKANKPRGRMGRGWDKLKSKIPGRGLLGRGAGTVARGAGALAEGGAASARAAGGVARAGGAVARGLGPTALRLVGTVGRVGLMGAGTLLEGGLMSAGMVSGGLSLLGSALGMAGTAIAAIVSSPITVPLLAAAAIGTAGYFAYKWLTKPDPQPIEKVRLVQYGWKASNIEAYKKMKSLEQKVASAVVFKGENAEFDSKKLNFQDMMKDFGLDPTNKDHASKFIDWFANRFRPIYLHHRALIKIVKSPKELDSVDDNKPDIKKQYLDQCLFPGEHYDITTSPIKDEPHLFTSQGSAERAITEAKAEVEKEGTKKDDKKEKPLPPGGFGTALKAELAKKDLESEKKKDAATNAAGVPNKIGADLEKTSAMNRLKAATAGSMAGPGSDPNNPVNSPAAPDGKPAGPPKSKDVKPKSGDAEKVKAELIKNMPRFGITTPNQQAAILGNVEHESGFQPISENLNYKPQTLQKLWPNRFPDSATAQATAAKGPVGIANTIYGGRMGNTEANDGWDYRGRGPIQITGKSNYSALSKIMGKDIVDDPDKLVTDPKTSAESALAYWKLNPQLGKLADAGNFQKVRQLINGGSIGAEDANARVYDYLDKIKSGEMKLDGTSSSGEGGTITQTATVSSPKPTTANSVENNPNAGPTPSTYSRPSPASMVASPRPSYDASSSSSSVPQAAPVRSATQDPYYQSQSKVNTGDSIGIMKDSLDESKAQTGLLTRIADALDNLPKALAETLAGNASATPPAATEKPSEANNYGRTPTPMPKASNAFKRQLAGA
jgi:predicted chitinase